MGCCYYNSLVCMKQLHFFLDPSSKAQKFAILIEGMPLAVVIKFTIYYCNKLQNTIPTFREKCSGITIEYSIIQHYLLHQYYKAQRSPKNCLLNFHRRMQIASQSPHGNTVLDPQTVRTEYKPKLGILLLVASN